VWWLTPIIPATWEAETGGLWFVANRSKTLVGLYLKEKVVCGRTLCNLSYMGGRRIEVQASLGKSINPSYSGDGDKKITV
jgi:hypothetical protein